MKLKICGMKYPENINQIAQLQPDYFGFIFHKKSARNFNQEIPKLSDSISKVGVFVDENIKFVREMVEKHQLQAVQLHGNESPEFCEQIQSEKLTIIKVFSIAEAFDFNRLMPYESVCDFFLFDTKGKLPGGNGYAFDWTILSNYPSTKPFFLSGGISLNNTSELNEFKKSQASTYCVAIDVNSKFEIEPGLKSYDKLKIFKSLL